MRIPFISLIAAGSLALGGCAYGDMGLGLGYGDYGSPYYGYGYGSPYGGYGGYGGYGDYDGYGYSSYGYGSPFGWYDNSYYPGAGIYVYDSYRRAHRWSDRQRSYWSSRNRGMTNSGPRTVSTSPNWSGFNRQSSMSYSDREASRQQRIQAREVRRQARNRTQQ